MVEDWSGRYASSKSGYANVDYHIRFAYEATGELTRFIDYDDLKYRSRKVVSFHRPETLKKLLFRRIVQNDAFGGLVNTPELW